MAGDYGCAVEGDFIVIMYTVLLPLPKPLASNTRKAVTRGPAGLTARHTEHATRYVRSFFPSPRHTHARDPLISGSVSLARMSLIGEG